MNPIIGYGLGSVALIGILVAVLGNFVGGKGGLLKKLISRKRKEHEGNVEIIRGKQAEVTVRIEESEKVAEEIKVAIRKKVAKTNREIEEVLIKAKESPTAAADLAKQLEEEW